MSVTLLIAVALRTGDPEIAEALDRLNAFRRKARLTAVTLDERLCRGCASHAEYLVRNDKHPSVQGLGIHDEDRSLPGYTAEGARAGSASNISTYPPSAAASWCMATLFHRIPILHPGLRRVGIGYARGGRWGWISVIDVMNGRQHGKPSPPVLWPVDGAGDAPLSLESENPNPIPQDKDGKGGHPITASFFGGEAVRAVKATLKAGDEDVPFWLSTPEAPVDPRFQANTICLIPKDPLRPGTLYTVTLSARVNGKAWAKRWSFTTGP